VRWPVLAGVDAEGLLLEPTGTIAAQVIALPDADWSPEMLVGIASGLRKRSVARCLAENGCRVLVPTLIDRKDRVRQRAAACTNITHREFIYRMAYEMGRHVIRIWCRKPGAVDWLRKQTADERWSHRLAKALYAL
jgi:hypothetical protein